MPKRSSVFVCQQCGAKFPKWVGNCSECGEWGTLIEEVEKTESNEIKIDLEKIQALKLKDVKISQTKRTTTNIKEFDRVLGGGIVPGTVVLLSGEPGIGKSTLLSQLSLKLVTSHQLQSVIYVCGEESPGQVKVRLKRLNKSQKLDKISNLSLITETDVDKIIAKSKQIFNETHAGVLIVDSIQTISTSDLSGMAGSISQMRESTQRLVNFAKSSQISTFLVGHVTKQGVMAGPKTIEHAIDTVLYFEGDRSGVLRLLRGVKNRFGSTDEVGIFQMTDKGLLEVSDPSVFSLKNKTNKKQIGSAYTVVFEGLRPILVEIQALVTKSFTPMPKRVINGLETGRAKMLIAVLQKHLNLQLWNYDVFLNIAGGFKVREPAVDLAVCSAIFSSYKNKSLPDKSVFMGEVSLLGRVTEVNRIKKRVSQAEALGFKKVFFDKNLASIPELKRLIK